MTVQELITQITNDVTEQLKQRLDERLEELWESPDNIFGPNYRKESNEKPKGITCRPTTPVL